MYWVFANRFILVFITCFGLVSQFSGISLADSGVAGMPQEDKRAESRAEKHALVVTDDYIIGPEDALEISVWRNKELSRQVTVRPDGRITLPLIGDVEAVGRTTLELRDEITEKLRSYKENPTVAIVVQGINSYYFYTQGAVAKVGKFPLLSRTTLIHAITLSGGFSPDAVRSRVTIFRLPGRGKSAEHQKIVVNYDDIILRGGKNIELKPGDTIVVPSETMVLIP